MKSIIGKIFLVLALLAIPLAAACGNDDTAATGDVVFAITDAAANMGEVTAMEMTVNQIRVRAEGGEWTTVSNETQTFDLLQLREMNMVQLMTQVQLQERNYDMVELNVSQVRVTNGSGTHTAMMINNRLQMECMLEVQTQTMATVNFDFIADESLHETVEGQYVFAPVVALQTRTQAQVQLKSNNEVDISGGTVRTNAQICMNISGQMGVGLKIQTNAQLQISAGKVIEAGGEGNGQGNSQAGGQTTASGTLTAVDAIAGTITVQISQGHDLELNVTSETEINIGSLVSTIVALVSEIGSEVEVTYSASTNVASEITVQ
ncbi:MAG: DUF4382 domain-containing protein [Dehalococcoidia bacterium]